MKILCPVDFSEASQNAIEYAAKLAQRLGATIKFVNVQMMGMSEGISMFSFAERESTKQKIINDQKLESYCIAVSAEFKVQCDHEVILSFGAFEKIIADESGKSSLIVTGTDGLDNISQFYFGTHSFRIAKNASCPVIIVPASCLYRDVKKIVFASDYNKGEKLMLEQLKKFTHIFNAELEVLHVSEKDSTISKEVYKAFCSMTEEALDDSSKIKFTRLISENEADSIESFMYKTSADLLVVYFEEHSIMYRLFHESLIKKLSSYAEFPMMLFHKLE